MRTEILKFLLTKISVNFKLKTYASEYRVPPSVPLFYTQKHVLAVPFIWLLPGYNPEVFCPRKSA
jgi:hypothetical protein